MLESREIGNEESLDESVDDVTERSDRSQLKLPPTEKKKTRSTTRSMNTPVKRSAPMSTPASTVKALKRKSSMSRDTPQKTPKLVGLIQHSSLALLKGLSPIPKESKQPKEIFQIFCIRCKDDSYDIVSFLTRLFFAVASPTAFYQL